MARQRMQIIDEHAARLVRLDQTHEADRLALVFRDEHAPRAAGDFLHARVPMRGALTW
ncbi:hypothetical protein [Caballeronia arvi]|uniref:hypothetical protein n=1 Tax=Caballeronia arvi TaxID=1777135 RepID=UPI002E145134